MSIDILPYNYIATRSYHPRRRSSLAFILALGPPVRAE